MKLTGWGNVPVLDCNVSAPRSEAELKAVIARGHAIARGNGRSYGDSAASRSNTIDMPTSSPPACRAAGSRWSRQGPS